jgi:hypothetical protein
MDTRDYFAGQALNALTKNDEDNPGGKDIKKIVSLAYRIADAMLAELELFPQKDVAGSNGNQINEGVLKPACTA